MTELTILFADIAESTSLFDKYGDVLAQAAISSVLDVLIKQAEQHQGCLVKTIGDEVMCTFPTANQALSSAVAMQMAVSGNFVLEKHPITIRIGFHQGAVIEEQGDVFGDAVNVAARMTSYAKKEQIITNLETFENCQLHHSLQHRTLGRNKVKGKLKAVEIIEILWQKDISQVTRITKALDLEEVKSRRQMELQLGRLKQTMTEQSPTKQIGRSDESDLWVNALMASREHGLLQFSGGNFKYTDQSTNGSWIKQDNGAVIRIHRDSIVLQGSGKIAFGDADFSDDELLLVYQISK